MESLLNWRRVIDSRLQTMRPGRPDDLRTGPGSSGNSIPVWVAWLAVSDRVPAPSNSGQTSRQYRMMAFWMCSLFSASSNTTDFGPSITADVTSSPL